ncbi:hypothetical protein Glove_183g71 [Diversispora epigaea]|uniref:Protein kinase domain-containing protein n=1 Tax=Diversispora epigaea TaxID=1348612 RepID=A0A397IR32_9GLOM|nr:hypothetical protein Glove_183g71 [Diversispora epigaea]
MSQENNHDSMREWETWMHNLIIEENIPFYQYSDFVNVDVIGENVYKATFRISQKTVALKRISLNDTFTLDNLINDIKRHRKLGIHDNILKFYGISKQENTNDYMIILEYTNNGYLRQYLKTNFQKLDWNAKLNLAKRISNVLMYLHSNDIIHGRLNSENILIHDENIKLNIFGLTKIMPESLRFLTNTIGPIQYIDPQYLENFNTICKNKNSDIYSLGIILWEISSGNPPFEMEPTVDLLDNIVKGKREMIILGTPSKYKELYTDCWNHNRNSRPDISQVVKHLSEIITSETSKSSSHNVEDEIISVKLETQSRPHNVTDEIISPKFGKTKKQKDELKMSEKALSVLPTQEERIELLKEHALEEPLEVYKNRKFSDAAKFLRSLGKFKEASVMLSDNLDKELKEPPVTLLKNLDKEFKEAPVMLNDNLDKEENMIDSLGYLLHPCVVNILVDTMNNESNQKELDKLINDAINIVTKVKSQPLKKSEKWYRLTEEFQLYKAYLKSDLNRVRECIQFFEGHNDTVVEFRALNIWLKIPPQSSNTEYWHERLQHLMRLCELAYDFIDSRKNVHNKKKINKNFEEFFFVEEVQDRPDKRKISISFDNPLIRHINEMHDKNVIEDLEDWKVYNAYIVHKAISKFLASYIYDLISKADQEGRNISDIASEICNENVKCKRQHTCRKHHVIPTPSIIHKRITLACLQYTVIRQLDTIYRLRLLIEEKSELVSSIQRFWAERLVDCHFRYQSPQSSCPEITHATIIKLPRHTYNGFVELSYKVWLDKEFDPCNFAKMLKCIFVLLQLRCRWGINKFNWETSHHSYNFMPGFVYTGRYYESVARRLALFVESLRDNLVIKAINQSKNFINYAIENSDQVKIVTSEAFGDLISLMEFTMFLILVARPGHCDFFLPRSYLVNYYDSFNLNPSLICLEDRNKYNRMDYINEITELSLQAKKLLKAMIDRDVYCTTIILRLIRLLTLIFLNESTLASDVLNYFKSLSNELYIEKYNKYLLENFRNNFVNILNDDLKENNLDSLVIVFYNWGGISKFSSWEKSGITKISYHSIEEFRSSLQKIIPSAVTEIIESDTPNYRSFQPSDSSEQSFTPIPVDNDEQIESQETAIAWFREICDSSQAQKAALKIQTWFHRIQNREKSRQSHYDPILDKIYKEVRLFCQNAMNETVRLYNVYLMGLTVDIIVELIKLQDRMDKNKNKLKKIISCSSDNDEQKIESCLELEDELKFVHNENVKLSLELLSTTENSEKHKEANIEWLENELGQAKDNIDFVLEWIEKCNEL